MAHPYDDNSFKHYLKFYDFDMDWYEICEPVGFDDAKYVKKQLNNRWTRDVEYFAIDGLTFIDALGESLETPRVFNLQGDLSYNMDYGLNFLLENRKLKGSEMKVGYKISRNGIDFKEFELDNRGEDITDGESYYKSKLIEVSEVADHFRNLKNTFNAFSDKNWKDETITPIESFNYLVKATPLNLVSEFKTSQNYAFDFINTPSIGALTGINPSQLITKSEVNNTLGWLNPKIDTNNFLDFDDFGLFVAQVSTTNVKISIDLDMDYEFLNGGGSLTGGGRINLYLYIGNDVSIGNLKYQFFERAVSPSENESGTINQVFTYEVNEVPVGQKVFLFYFMQGIGDRRIKGLFRKNEIKVEVVETELDIVCPAVRYIDLIKQGGKFVNELPVVAPIFDIGGEFYNQAIFSKALLGQKKELYTTNEALQQSLQEVCADVEISTENIDIRQHQDFYENIEIGSFLVIPSEDYTEPYDEYYLINNFGYGYKNFEQDRTTKNTIKSFHTTSEWLPNNLRADKQKKIENDLIRDPFLKQTTFNLEIKNPTTSTEKDEKLFIEDMIMLAPNTSREFVRTLLMRWESNKLEILNKNTLGTNEEAILNWNNIGLGVGRNFEIKSGANIGNYTVFSINDIGTILTLTPIGVVTKVSGNYTIKMKHFYTNVLWQTRTNEGFSIAPSGFSNLAYTIKRNIKYWYYYLATALIYSKKDIKNSFFKNFGDLETQLNTETTPVIEKATILYNDLPNPIVEPITIKSKIVANYEDVLEYLENYRTKKGFIRLYNTNGNVLRVFPKMFEYTISTNEANIEGEKKFETQYLTLTYSNDILTVNDAQYNLQGNSEWWKFENDYIKLYDNKNRPLSNFYKFNLVNLNGIVYNSKNELITALLAL